MVEVGEFRLDFAGRRWEATAPGSSRSPFGSPPDERGGPEILQIVSDPLQEEYLILHKFYQFKYSKT